MSTTSALSLAPILHAKIPVGFRNRGKGDIRERDVHKRVLGTRFQGPVLSATTVKFEFRLVAFRPGGRRQVGVARDLADEIYMLARLSSDLPLAKYQTLLKTQSWKQEMKASTYLLVRIIVLERDSLDLIVRLPLEVEVGVATIGAVDAIHGFGNDRRESGQSHGDRQTARIGNNSCDRSTASL